MDGTFSFMCFTTMSTAVSPSKEATGQHFEEDGTDGIEVGRECPPNVHFLPVQVRI